MSHLFLIAGILGLARGDVAGRGSLGRNGVRVTVLGLGILTIAEPTSLIAMDVAIVFYSIATQGMLVGLVLTGIAVLRARRWTGWLRYTPLACGLYILLVLTPTLALPGRASHYAIGFWGVWWILIGYALFGYALWTQSSQES